MGLKDEIKEETIEHVSTMHRFNNSDVVRHVLFSLINVATNKTSDDYAWSTLKKLLKELEREYSFLKYIEIKHIDYLKYTMDDINIAQQLNQIQVKELGKSIQDLIDLYKKYLGKKAGYFFIKEFKTYLGEEYHSVIKNMGVDLRLIELQNEIKGLDAHGYKIKEDSSSNIAYVEKRI
ncbi:MAG: hypothetical protein DRM99_05965 [Thermoplasmata archaeon]|nr:MAG: hypothetical protein DRM99_05965 [Thermoplasmata archaeon]